MSCTMLCHVTVSEMGHMKESGNNWGITNIRAI